ncbi:MAG: tol-pal system protein YbgF [Polaromonas sp.]
MFSSNRSKILTPGVVSAFGVVVGSAVHSLSSRNFRWEGFRDAQDRANRLVGAVLMGVCGVCAMGCTMGQVGQGLSGISTVSAFDLRQRIERIEASQQRTADDLKRVNDDNSQLRRSLLDLSSQIEALRGEVATMRGQNEQMARSIADMQRHQKDLTQGVDERLRKFEPGKVTVDGKEFVAEPAEKQEFEAALAVLRKGDFAAAQTSFQAFMKRYPQSGYKSSALFWLGNAQYALRNYRDAEANFRALAAAEPDHVRAPEALLSMANCQVELNDVKAARKTLEDLVKAYPQSEAASVAKERLVKLK